MPRIRCLHDWELKTDWAGDPDVINGTYSWHLFSCRNCGHEREPTEKELRDIHAGRYEPDDY